MPKVKLKDVVMRVKEKVDKDDTDLEYYVGGEHIDGNEICVSRRGVIQGSTIGPAFHMAFKAGDVLLMSRNPHLRKASMVDFDGICSDVSYICRTKDENVLLQSFLPFLMQTNDFWRFAEENKKGGLPFFLNWSDFERYEFELPPIDKQRELSQLLWAMQRTKQAYQTLLTKSDELVKSQFIELFGSPIKNPNAWPTLSIGDATEDILSGQCLNGAAGILQPGQKAVLKVSAVTYGDFKADEYKVLYDPKQITKGIYPQNGDLLFSRANTKEYVGATALIDRDYPDLMLPDKLWKLVFKPIILPIFAKYFLSHPEVRAVLSEMATGTSGSMFNISMEKLKDLKIIVPDMNTQLRFIEFAQQLDKSKFELRQGIANINNLMNSLMQQDFSN